MLCQKKQVVGVIVLVLVVVVGVWYRSNNRTENISPENKVVIKIGATLPLTGDVAFLGGPHKQAMLMALEDVQKASSLKYNYQIIFEDDQFNSTKAVTAANKLVSVDGTKALVSFGSPAGNAINPIAQLNKVVHINGFASDPNVAKGEYNFVHWTPPYEEAGLLVKELESRGIKKVVVFDLNHSGALPLSESFVDMADKQGIEVAARYTSNPEDRDFRTIIQKAKAQGAEMFVILLPSPYVEILAKQIKEFGVKTPMTSIESFQFTDQPQLFTGLWYVTGAEMKDWFVQQFTQNYGVAPNMGSGNGYDVVALLIKAFEKAGDGKNAPSSEDLSKALGSIKNFDGAMGDNMKFDQEGIVVTKATVKIVP